MPRFSLFDIQVNGFAGVDFQQPGLTVEAMLRATRSLAAHETLRFFVTLVTDSLDNLEAKFLNFERLRKQDKEIAEAVCGYHLEGPWLSPEPGYRGAHDPAHMRPPHWEDFERLQRAAGGNIRLVTLAPELPGSAPFIKKLTSLGVRVSLGHTAASHGEIQEAIVAGAKFCTHLGNGVPLELHRHDNVIQRLLAQDELMAFFVPDGIHLPPYTLQNFFRAKPSGKAFFTTDCMAAAGAPAGRYRIAHHEVEVGEDRVVRMPGSQAFAGSALEPDRGVKNVIAWLGLGENEARSLFSTAVAREFGVTLPEIASSST